MSRVSLNRGSYYLSPKIKNDILKLRKTRNAHLFESQNPRTKRYGPDCIVYTASQICQTPPIGIRDSISVRTFNHKIKTWYCLLLLQDLGFI